MKIKYCSIQIP